MMTNMNEDQSCWVHHEERGSEPKILAKQGLGHPQDWKD